MSAAEDFARYAFDINQIIPIWARGVPKDLGLFVSTVPLNLIARLLDEYEVPVPDDLNDRPSVESFFRNLPGATRANITSNLDELHTIARWAAEGMPVFNLTHGAVAAFLLTDSSNVRIEDFHPPFSTFMLTLPPGAFVMPTGRSVECMFWHDFLLPESHFEADSPTSYASYSSPLSGLVGPEDTRHTFATTAVRAYGGSRTAMGTPGQHPIFTFRHQNRPDRDTLECPDTAFSVRDGRLAHKDQASTYGATMQMLYAFCLYVAENGRGQAISKASRSSSTARPATGPLEPSIWLTGKEIKVDKALREAAAALLVSEERPEGWKLRSRFTVRGHWRNQVCGTGRAERRLRWIAPYWKCPKDGVGIAHLYETKDPK